MVPRESVISRPGCPGRVLLLLEQGVFKPVSSKLEMPALEQEMIARVQEMQAKVVEAQSQVPLAMAEAFRSGRLGVMDYYKMENIQGDTAMRQSIAKPEEKK